MTPLLGGGKGKFLPEREKGAFEKKEKLTRERNFLDCVKRENLL